MKEICDKCLSEFSSKANLKYHQSNAKYCKNLQYILFLCKNCYQSFHNMKDINNHLLDCIKDKYVVNNTKINNDENKLDNSAKIINDINNMVKTISSSNKYIKSLKKLQNIRLSLLNYMDIKEYTKFISKNLEQIKVEIKKNISKLPRNITIKILNQFELRLIDYNKCSKQISQNTRNQIKKLIINNSKYPFKYDNFISKFKNEYNYVFSIEELIEFNINNNIIYIENNKQVNKDDLYSFYYLDYEKDGKKYWKQDCRLEKLTSDIRYELISYGKNLYREIYYKVFHDNIYRNNMSIHSPLIEYDCEQILYNIIYVSNFKFFNNYLRKLIYEKYTHKKTCNDILNLKMDDKIQKEDFNILQKEKNIIKNIRELYDDIPVKILIEFVNNKLKNFDLKCEL